MAIVLASLAFLGGARRAHAAESAAKVVRVGVYLQRLHTMSLKDNSFTIDFYLWFRWSPQDFPSKALPNGAETLKPPTETFEIVGSSSVEKQVVSQSDGYACLRVKAQLTQFWKVDRFPFDDHVLRLVLEDSASELHLVRYEPDVEGSSVAPDFEVPGWTPQPLQVRVGTHEYRTSFGDPNLPTGNRALYSQVAFEMPVARRGLDLFFKLFTGLFVSVAIALVAFFVRATEVDPRFGLPVGGLFAAVASEYVVTGSLPDSAAVSLADRLHLVSFLAILAVVIESAVALQLLQRGGDRLELVVRRLDRGMFYVVALAWAVMVATLTWRARAG